MREDIKARWIEALTSGAYQQGTGALKIHAPGDGTKHCCLGVLCELYVAEHPYTWMERERDNKKTNAHEVVEELLGEDNFLPEPVQAWAGIESNNGVFEDAEGEHDLAGLNDDGWSFADLAGLIEARF